MKFTPNKTYRHSNPNTSVDIHIISIEDKDSNSIRMKVTYIQRHNGRIQYTGNGMSDEIEIKIKDLEYWSEI